MKQHTYKTRVRYAETDQMGVVYYANYLAYMESARTTLLREGGYPYGELEKDGYLLPVTECKVNYKGSARFDEEITVKTALDYVKNASIKINYAIYNEAGTLIVTGYTVHPFINPEWKIVPIPEGLKEMLCEYIAP